MVRCFRRERRIRGGIKRPLHNIKRGSSILIATTARARARVRFSFPFRPFSCGPFSPLCILQHEPDDIHPGGGSYLRRDAVIESSFFFLSDPHSVISAFVEMYTCYDYSIYSFLLKFTFPCRMRIGRSQLLRELANGTIFSQLKNEMISSLTEYYHRFILLNISIKYIGVERQCNCNG